MSVDVFGDGTVRLDRAQFVSPAGSLFASVPAAAPDGVTDFARGLVEYRSTTPSVSVADMAFSLRLEKIGDENATGLANFIFEALDKQYEPRLNVDPTGRLYISQFDPKTSEYDEPYKAPLPLPLRSWVRVHFHVELQGAGKGTADLDVDGKRLATGVALKPTLAGGAMHAVAGVVFVRSPTSGWALHLDDLAISPK